MLVCNALMRILIGENFSIERIKKQNRFENIYKYILRLVLDNDDTAKGAFSIQNICKMGFANGKFPGEWYGP
jgi:Peptidase family C54